MKLLIHHQIDGFDFALYLFVFKKKARLVFKNESVIINLHTRTFNDLTLIVTILTLQMRSRWNYYAHLSDINNVGSLSKLQITPDANKRITAVSYNFPWREILFYGRTSDDVLSLLERLQKDERLSSNRIIYFDSWLYVYFWFKNKNEIENVYLYYIIL